MYYIDMLCPFMIKLKGTLGKKDNDMTFRITKVIKRLIVVTLVFLLSSCNLPTTIDEDTIKPIITLTGEDTLYLEVGDSYLELGATCTDDTDSTCSVVVDSTDVNTTVIGNYEVTYNATVIKLHNSQEQ